MGMRVSEIAQQVGVSPDTVRYYERLGLLPPADRTPAGYREYDAEMARRLRFIKGAQTLGLRLADIRDLLDVQDHGACPCGHTQSLIDRRLRELDEEIEQLSSLRKQLVGMRDLDCSLSPEQNDWPCEIEFVRRGGELNG